MNFKFPSLQDCHNASNELSKYFSGNGIHYETNVHEWGIKLLSSCPDMHKGREICMRHGGAPR